MARIDLEAQPRQILGKAVKVLRRQGVTPANMYSPGKDSVPLQLQTHALELALARVTGPTEVWLKIADQAPARVVIKEVQIDPRRGGLHHVDFFLPS